MFSVHVLLPLYVTTEVLHLSSIFRVYVLLFGIDVLSYYSSQFGEGNSIRSPGQLSITLPRIISKYPLLYVIASGIYSTVLCVIATVL
jgi:hypothetical protein